MKLSKYQDRIDAIAYWCELLSQNKFNLIQSNIPTAPLNLTAVTTDTSVILNWTNTFLTKPFTNVIYYANQPNTVKNYHTASIGVGEQSSYELKIPSGGYLEFMVTTVDTLGAESLSSNVVTLNWISSTPVTTFFLLRICQRNLP